MIGLEGKGKEPVISVKCYYSHSTFSVMYTMVLVCGLPYFFIDNECVIYTNNSKFVKNEHARYTFERYER
jgi:hypothetical protein